MEQLLLELLIRLEAVGKNDESLFDTVVREKLNDAIFYAYIKPEPGYVLPDEYEMRDEENLLIKAALQGYIEGAKSLAPALGLNSFHKRLAAFQNMAIRTKGTNDYEDFFGWLDPDLFDDAGNVKTGV